MTPVAEKLNATAKQSKVAAKFLSNIIFPPNKGYCFRSNNSRKEQYNMNLK